MPTRICINKFRMLGIIIVTILDVKRISKGGRDDEAGTAERKRVFVNYDLSKYGTVEGKRSSLKFDTSEFK